MQVPIPQTKPRLVKRFGVVFCSDCGFQFDPIRICNCQPSPPQSSALDGADMTGLAQRIVDAQKATP